MQLSTPASLNSTSICAADRDRRRDEYLTESDAAQLLKLSRRTLQRYRQEGGGPVYARLGHRRVVYRRSDLATWADTRRFGSAEEEASAR
ncbi:helix-turn-helix transcriptional regulator [Azospirillum sp. ST 5-10]|uniref:helix-turn-helix transcriptional regulator n=1 Tax=unclassified Azospirillum TaxID=2630922 RepID=UPI003F4A3D0E